MSWRLRGTAAADRTYHGFEPPNGPARLLVEEPAYGPTEREHVRVLRELHAEDEHLGGGFNWGYSGGGPGRAATAILADALDLGDPKEAGMTIGADPQNRTLVALRNDFCEDMLTQCCKEWRLSRMAILRWAHSWYLQHAPTAMPPACRNLPSK